MVFTATFAVMLIISITTIQCAPTKRQSSVDSDDKIKSLLRGVRFLGDLSANLSTELVFSDIRSTERVCQNNTA